MWSHLATALRDIEVGCYSAAGGAASNTPGAACRIEGGDAFIIGGGGIDCVPRGKESVRGWGRPCTLWQYVRGGGQERGAGSALSVQRAGRWEGMPAAQQASVQLYAF